MHATALYNNIDNLRTGSVTLIFTSDFKNSFSIIHLNSPKGLNFRGEDFAQLLFFTFKFDFKVIQLFPKIYENFQVFPTFYSSKFSWDKYLLAN